eukprot:UN00805
MIVSRINFSIFGRHAYILATFLTLLSSQHTLENYFKSVDIFKI